MNELQNEMVEWTDLEPTDEVKGGIGVDAGSSLTINGVISNAATQGRGMFTISTDRICPQ